MVIPSQKASVIPSECKHGFKNEIWESMDFLYILKVEMGKYIQKCR